MAGTVRRRPLPALIALVALLALTGIVWVRVLDRHSSADPKPSGTPCPTASTQAPLTVLPNPRTVAVLVLNSTKRNGIATSARLALLAAGFLSPQAAGNDNPKTAVKGVAEIRYGPTGAAGANLLRYYFPGARLAGSVRIATALVTVSLGAAYAGVAPPAAVTAAIAKARATVSSTAPAPSGSATC